MLITPIHQNKISQKRPSFKGWLTYTNAKGVKKMLNTDCIQSIESSKIKYSFQNDPFDADYIFDTVKVILKKDKDIREGVEDIFGNVDFSKRFVSKNTVDTVVAVFDKFAKALQQAVVKGFATIETNVEPNEDSIRNGMRAYVKNHLPLDTVTETSRKRNDYYTNVEEVVEKQYLKSAPSKEEIEEKMQEFEKPLKKMYKDGFHTEYRSFENQGQKILIDENVTTYIPR